jgi:hypothetical protein
MRRFSLPEEDACGGKYSCCERNVGMLNVGKAITSDCPPCFTSFQGMRLVALISFSSETYCSVHFPVKHTAALLLDLPHLIPIPHSWRFDPCEKRSRDCESNWQYNMPYTLGNIGYLILQEQIYRCRSESLMYFTCTVSFRSFRLIKIAAS